MDAFSVRLALADERATLRLAEDVALALKAGDVVALSGDLGAGKSTFARALIRNVAADEDREVPSPTFTLVQTYDDLRLPIAHFDLYRLSDDSELAELGLSEALEAGAALIEWPERAADALPSTAIRLHLADGNGHESRLATLTANGPPAARLRRSLAIRGFLDAHGYRGAGRAHLQGDASSRAYETIVSGTGENVLLMNAPAQPDGPPIRDGLPYSRIAHLAETVTPFVAVADWLRSQGFCAPRVDACDLDGGMLILENLGSDAIISPDGVPVEERYHAAAHLLAALHAVESPGRLDVRGGGSHTVPAYDRGALQIETELLLDWYWPAMRADRPDRSDRDAFNDLWAEAFEKAGRQEQTLVLRDYHSPNIIWRPERLGLERIGVIDFQDAVIGPAAYDVGSLVYDARVTIPEALGDAIVTGYVAKRRQAGSFDEAGFREALAIMSAQRISKILGIFVRLKERDGKPDYMRHLPRMRRYLGLAMRHPVLADLRRWYGERGLLDERA